MMKHNSLCERFGHVMPRGCGGAPYLRIKNIATDAAGMEHAYLYTTCDRCGVEWNVANIHLPREKEKQER